MSPAEYAIEALVLLLIGAHCAWQWKRGRFFILDPINTFWAGLFVCYVLQPLNFGAQLRSWHGDDVFRESLLLVLAAVIMIIAGYESRLGVKATRLIPSLSRRLRPTPMFVLGMAVAALGVVGYAYLISSAGQFSTWITVGRGDTDYRDLNAYVMELAELLPAGIGLLIFHVEIHKVDPVKRILVWFGACLMLAFLIYLGSRSRTIGFSMIMLCAYYLPRRSNPRLLLVACAFFILLTVANFQAIYRGNFTDLAFNVDLPTALSNSLPSLSQISNDRGTTEVSRGTEFNVVMTIVELVPDEVDYNHGYGLLELFTRPIPRSIWPDKLYPNLEALFPIMDLGGLSESWVATSQRYLLMGPATTFVGYWYAAGGWIAIILAGYLTGALFRLIRSIYDRDAGNHTDTILYANLLMIGFIEAAATPLTWVFTLPFVVVTILVISKLAGAKARPRAGAMFTALDSSGTH